MHMYTPPQEEWEDYKHMHASGNAEVQKPKYGNGSMKWKEKLPIDIIV